MPMSDDAIDELTALLKKARQKDLPFGLCLGKKPEDNVMVLDLKKSSEVLMRTAKKDGETSKVTHGQVGVQGKIISMTLGGKMLPGLAKNMKMFLNKNKIKMKVVILDESGQELESDGDEDAVDQDTSDQDQAEALDTQTEAENTDDADDAQIAADTGDEDDPLAAKWASVHDELDSAVARFAGSGHPKAAAIAKAWEGGLTAANSGNYKVALAVGAKIKPLVLEDSGDANTGETADDPNAARWAQLQGPIEKLFLEVMNLNPADAGKLRAVWAAAGEAARAGDFTKAIAIASKLKPMLDAAKAAGASAGEQAVPQDIVAFQKSKLAWSSARDKMQGELGQLITAIKDACGDSEELKPVVSKADGLNKQLDGLNTVLDDALDAVINAPVGPQRVSAMQTALKVVGDLQAKLKEPFFQDVDSKNGFTSVKVTETASKSLGAIAKIIDTQVKAAA